MFPVLRGGAGASKSLEANYLGGSPPRRRRATAPRRASDGRLSDGARAAFAQNKYRRGRKRDANAANSWFERLSQRAGCPGSPSLPGLCVRGVRGVADGFVVICGGKPARTPESTMRGPKSGYSQACLLYLLVRKLLTPCRTTAPHSEPSKALQPAAQEQHQVGVADKARRNEAKRP